MMADGSKAGRKRPGLRTRAIAFLFLILTASLVLILANAWFQYRDIRQRLTDEARYLAGRASASIHRVVDAQIGHLVLAGQLGSVRNGDRAGCVRELGALMGTLQRYSAIGVAAKNGEITCVFARTGNTAGNVADREWFREIVDGTATTFETLIGRFSNRAVLVGAVRAAYPSESAAVVFASIEVGWLQAVLSREAVGTDDMVISLIDGRGQVLAHTGLREEDARESNAELWAAIREGKRHVVATDIDGVKREFQIAPIVLADETRFYIAAGIDSDEAGDRAYKAVESLLMPYLILFLACMALGYFTMERTLVQPIDRIIGNVRRYGAGELEVRLGPPYSDTEVGELAQALDQLADDVGARNTQVSSTNQRLQAAAERQRALIAASPVPIVALSREWKVQLWNAAAESVFGYTADEAVGGEPPIVPEYDTENSKELVERVVNGETITNVQLKRIHKSGKLLDVCASLAPLRGDNGTVDGAIVIFIDETQRQQVERQLIQSQKMESLGQLTGGLSHDFNNLLGVIIGNLDFLLDELDAKPELRAYADAALNAALHGAELNKRLLAFARRQALEPKVIDIRDEVTSIVDVLRRTLGERVRVETRYSDDVGLVRVDPSQLQSAIMNLGLNARDAMPDGGTLCVELGSKRFEPDSLKLPEIDVPSGHYVSIAVSDTGIGMSEDIAKKVFEPFFTTKPVGQGTGLGLSMVHGFAKQSGGHISCYSELGRGTTFRLYLPRHDRQEAGGDAAENSEQIVMNKDITVLLVEDNADLRRVAATQLQRFGCNVVETEDAAAALAYLRTGGRADLMLSDIVMPGMSGRELADEVSRMRPDLKILLMSGYSDPRGEKAEDMDRWPRLTKPFRREELYEAIGKLLPAARDA